MLDPIIGEHPTLRHIRKQLPVLATSGETLVIVGEHGTGKSLLAHHIHAQSPFAKNKLITVDCSLLKERDQRIMLFGGDLSSFSTTYQSPLEHHTTVIIKHPECAHSNHQSDLVNALQRRHVARTGSKRKLPVQCRVIFFLDTNERSLDASGKFQPLLRSLLRQSRHVTLPPLRRRRGDIPILMEYYARNMIRHHSRISGFSKTGKPHASILKRPENHRWRGNVAKLRVFVQSLAIPSAASVLEGTELLHLRDAMAKIDDREAFSLKDQLNAIRSLLIARPMHAASGKRVQAAQLLGLTEGTLRDRPAHYGTNTENPKKRW